MVEFTPLLNMALIVAMVIIALMIFCCLIRAIKGPSFSDRIVATNMIGTMTIMFVLILSVYFKQDFLVDVAVVYALLSFVAVVVFCRLVTVHHKGRQMHITEKEDRKKW